MSEWSWVALGFTVTYASMTGYAITLYRRRKKVRQELERLH